MQKSELFTCIILSKIHILTKESLDCLKAGKVHDFERKSNILYGIKTTATLARVVGIISKSQHQQIQDCFDKFSQQANQIFDNLKRKAK